jgi:hypothetical protein
MPRALAIRKSAAVAAMKGASAARKRPKALTPMPKSGLPIIL